MLFVKVTQSKQLYQTLALQNNCGTTTDQTIENILKKKKSLVTGKKKNRGKAILKIL